MNKTISLIMVNDYFKPTMKLEGIERYQFGKNIKRIYNRILDKMADKTIDLLHNI